MEVCLVTFVKMRSVLAVILVLDLSFSTTMSEGTLFPYHTSAALSTSGLAPVRKSSCKRLEGLTVAQVKWCKSHHVFMQPIASGAKLGLAECKRRFSDRRWSCPTDRQSVFRKALITANPEAAFVHGIQSAGITLAIARTCSRGDALSHCGCDKTLTAKESPDWTWGSCSDNFHKGEEFAKQFLDGSRNDSSPVSLVENYNHQTGRLVVGQSLQLVCKCHGLTGTCAHRTCWYSLPKVQVIGEKLLTKYDAAMRVKWEQPSESLVPYSALVSNLTAQLVFDTPSVDYCEANADIGAPGTQGRVCNPRLSGVGGCTRLCCGRGHNERRRIETKKCKCKFVWCCRVECERCRTVSKRYTCV